MKIKFLIAALLNAALSLSVILMPACQRALPVGELPSAETPSNDQSDETSPEDDPTEETPSEDDPADETKPDDSTEETPSEDDPAEETPPDDDPTEETPSEDDPTEDLPPDDNPAEEAPPDDDSTEETPPVDDPTEETPPDDSTEETPPEQSNPFSARYDFSSCTQDELPVGQSLVEGYIGVNSIGGASASVDILSVSGTTRRGAYLTENGGESIKITLPEDCVVEIEVFNVSIFSSVLAVQGEGISKQFTVAALSNSQGGNSVSTLTFSLPAGEYDIFCAKGMLALLSLYLQAE